MTFCTYLYCTSIPVVPRIPHIVGFAAEYFVSSAVGGLVQMKTIGTCAASSSPSSRSLLLSSPHLFHWSFTSDELLQTFLLISPLTLSSLTCRQSDPHSPLCFVFFPFLVLYSLSRCPCCFYQINRSGAPFMEEMESHRTNTHDRPLCAAPECIFVCLCMCLRAWSFESGVWED